MTRVLRIARAIAFALALAHALGAAASASRVVAIGDVHGAYEPLVEILQAADLIDEKQAWSGGDATLVQLGDFTDRGNKVRAVMDLLMRLQEEAARAGGRVIVLLGNHEALNLVGELRDVSTAALLEFATPNESAEQDAEYREVIKAGRLRARLTGAPRPIFDDAAHETWKRAHPPGTIGYLRALLPDGRYGKWLRGLPTVTVVDDVLFLHAGLDPTHATASPEEINGQVRSEVEWLDACRAALRSKEYLTVSSTSSDLIRVGFALLEQLGSARSEGRLAEGESTLLSTLERCVDYEKWHLFSPEGPLWFRGYADPRPSRPGSEGYGWTEAEGAARVAEVLASQRVRHVVVAHSPRESATIGVRFGGRAFLIDTGMLAEVYNGKPSALEIDRGVFTAIYTDRREELWNDERSTAVDEGVRVAQAGGAAATPPPRSSAAAVQWRWAGPDGKTLPFRGPEELEDFLRTAELTSSEAIPSGINRPLKITLERDGIEAHAVFRTVAIEERNQQGPGGKYYRDFRDNYAFECAAYELAGALGITRVPPAVPRQLQGKEGSVQAWVENAMTEAKRAEKGEEPPDVLRWARTTADKLVFDALVNNIDRNSGNELIDKDWNVWWIDHTRAFQTEHGDQRIEDLRRITPELWSALREVERARVRTVLQPFLRPSEIEALFQRWDKILLRYRTLIAELGPENVIVGF
jgi:hypothetical protein